MAMKFEDSEEPVTAGRMSVLVEAVGKQLNAKVVVVRCTIFVPVMRKNCVKGYKVYFKSQIEDSPTFVYRCKHAEEVKRYLASLADLINFGIIVLAPFNKVEEQCQTLPL